VTSCSYETGRGREVGRHLGSRLPNHQRRQRSGRWKRCACHFFDVAWSDVLFATHALFFFFSPLTRR